MKDETSNQTVSDNRDLDIKSTAIKFGIIGGLAGVLVSLVLFFANLQLESWSKWLQTLVMLVAIIAGIKAIADTNKFKFVPFGSLFGGGMLITLIITLISIVYFLLYSNFIEPDFIDKLLDITRQQMSEKGLSEEQIDTALNISKKFMSPTMMTFISLISSLIVGAITSLIGAAIFKNEE